MKREDAGGSYVAGGLRVVVVWLWVWLHRNEGTCK